MKLVKVAASILNQTPLAWDENRERILATIRAARAEGVTVLCLPELCITGYGCEDSFLSPGVQQMALEVLADVLAETEGMIVSVGLPLMVQNAVFNTACLIANQQILGFTAKRFLAGDGLHYEHRWFKPWPTGQRTQVFLFDRDYPVGDLYYDCGGLRIGFEICEDAWVAKRSGSDLALRGVDLILNPSASHFAFRKAEIRERFVVEGSRAFSCSYVYSNLLGNEAGRVIYDGGTLIASAGTLLAQGPRFSYRDWNLTTAVIDVDYTRMNQSRGGGYQPQLETDSRLRIRIPFELPNITPETTVREVETWEESEHLKEEEFTRAVGLALFDYLRKSYSHGFVVSLSGGADSSAVACLVRLSLEFASQNLGPEALKEKLSFLRNVERFDSVDHLTRQLLSTVYQSTKNSSDTTRNAARAVAEAVHATHLEWDVDELVGRYTGIIGDAVGTPLNWEDHDLPLQNIQARVRAPGVWLLTNVKNALLLATSNRSEAAVGYATMDGDTCGGLSPIAGIDKAFLRSWLRWLETVGPTGLSPIPELSAVNQLAPTAELRPSEDNQTDEGDLMPYDLLDAIERCAIRDKQTPLEIFRLVQVAYPQYSSDQLVEWIERFFRLWCRNQWKRERYAPSFHVDDENLDPKSWCRFPILSGGYQKELQRLREYLDKEA